MFNLIYIILGIYFLILVVTVLKEYYIKKRSTCTKEKMHLLKRLFSKSKKDLSEKHDIFILKHNNKEISEEDMILNKIVTSKEKRHLAFQNAKYKCEECGGITNIEVYNININSNSSDSDENLKVLCKKCSKEYSVKMNLHYEK